MAKPGDRAGRSKLAPGEGGINHTVQRGETLFSIAEKYYGNGYEWVRLKEYNPWVDQERLNIGEIIHIPEPKHLPRGSTKKQSFLNLPSGGSLLSWIPGLQGVSLFGKNLQQILMMVFTWFTLHFSIQGIFVWFAAHLAFVKDVSIRKAMKATFQSESLALICILVVGFVGLMLLYVGTTSPGKPVSAELVSTAEDYLQSPTGMAIAGILLVALYGFLGIRFIPPAFGIQAGRGMAVVLISILLPHLIGLYLVSHRMGLIN